MRAMSKRYCSSCSKPLGSTKDKCHACGGESRRGGNPIRARQWQMLLIPVSANPDEDE